MFKANSSQINSGVNFANFDSNPFEGSQSVHLQLTWLSQIFNHINYKCMILKLYLKHHITP